MKSILDSFASTKPSHAASTRVEAKIEYEQAKMFFGINSPEAQIARQVWQGLRGESAGGREALAAS